MDFALHPDALAAGYGLVTHGSIGSTSADAMARLRDGASGPLWVVSDHQTAGRGRRGAAWATPPGNLAASLALRLDQPAALVATLGFVAGIAAVQALERCGPTASFRLKWPNDVLMDGRKLVGILLESEDSRQGRLVVVGIGINVRHAPESRDYATASLAGLGGTADAAKVFAALSACWAEAYAAWDAGRGFPAVRAAWLDRAAGLGGPVAVRSGSAALRGTFETIDAAGQLVVRLADGEARAVGAGDVFFGNAGSLRAEAVA